MKRVSNEISIVSYSLPWFVARDEGFFEAEDLEVEFVRARRRRGTGSADPDHVDPILGHVAFDEGEVAIYRA
jgi:NitT/TauT family transport system substrate-binding protein